MLKCTSTPRSMLHINDTLFPIRLIWYDCHNTNQRKEGFVENNGYFILVGKLNYLRKFDMKLILIEESY
jgi:hypothetical protein